MPTLHMATDAVCVGFEAEFLPNMGPSECLECGHELNYGDYGSTIEWWEGGFPYHPSFELAEEHGSMLEYKHDGPTEFGEARELFKSLLSDLSNSSARLGRDAGFHVHLDCREDSEIRVDPEVTWKLWHSGWQDTAWQLIDNNSRREDGNAYVNRQRNVRFERRSKDKYNDLNFSHEDENDYGTIELRMWDTTFNRDLHEKRMVWLAEFLSAIFTEMDRPTVDPMDAGIAAMFMQAQDNEYSSQVWGLG